MKVKFFGRMILHFPDGDTCYATLAVTKKCTQNEAWALDSGYCHEEPCKKLIAIAKRRWPKATFVDCVESWTQS